MKTISSHSIDFDKHSELAHSIAIIRTSLEPEALRTVWLQVYFIPYAYSKVQTESNLWETDWWLLILTTYNLFKIRMYKLWQAKCWIELPISFKQHN